MFGSEILEVTIGLVFVYLLFSLLATTVNELLTGLFSIRARFLRKTIENLLGDGLGKDFYRQPYLRKFCKHERSPGPSYIAKTDFAKILLDVLNERKPLRYLHEVEEGVYKLPDGGTKETLLSLVRESRGSVLNFSVQLEDWYEGVMHRTVGWYKRENQKILIGIALAIAIVFNADSIRIVKKLSSNPEARTQIINLAEDYRSQQLQSVDTLIMDSAALKVKALQFLALAKNKQDSALLYSIDSLNKQISTLVKGELQAAVSVLGLGWGDLPSDPGQAMTYLFKRLFGWAITALAISLGAPFWFDILNKVIKLRSSGVKPREQPPNSKRTSCEDQTGVAAPAEAATLDAPSIDDQSPHDIPAYG